MVALTLSCTKRAFTGFGDRRAIKTCAPLPKVYLMIEDCCLRMVSTGGAAVLLNVFNQLESDLRPVIL
jgi:hypothetical protein